MKRQRNLARDRNSGGFSAVIFLLYTTIASLVLSMLQCRSLWADESAILTHFRPYSQGTPRIPGLEPGVTLSRNNVHPAKEMLPPEILQLIESGALEVAIQETTDLPPRQAYLDATIQHSHTVSLDGGGPPVNYLAGTPFPLLDSADPQAGEKLAWNLRHRDMRETFELRANPRQINASGGVEHSNRGHMRIRFGMYRPNPTDNDPQWQAQGIYLKNSFELLAPSDQEGNTVRHFSCAYGDEFLLPAGEGQDEGEKERYSLLNSLTLALSRREREFCTTFCPTSKFVPNTIDQEGVMNLRTFYANDQRATEQWRYSPHNRRTRKDHVNFVTPIGGYYEMLQEEQPPFFFQGYLHEYTWAYGGSRLLLVPGFLKTTELNFGGKNNWYLQVPWELRYVLLLECTPRRSHPFGKRVFVLDQQTYTPLMILTYNAEGAFVRFVLTAHTHPTAHPGSNGLPLPVFVGSSWINYVKDRATLFTVGDSMTYNAPLAAQRFELMEILRKGK